MQLQKRKVFTGIGIPEEVKTKLWGVSLSLQKFGYPVSWVSKERMHITLLYLGYLNGVQIDEVFRILQEKIPNKLGFEVAINKIEGFPEISAPRVIVTDLGRGFVELKDIYMDLFDRFYRDGFQIDKEVFRAHITLGRVKSDDFFLKKKIGEAIRQIKLPNFRSFFVNNVSLFESILIDHEFVYKELLSVPLKKYENTRN